MVSSFPVGMLHLCSSPVGPGGQPGGGGWRPELRGGEDSVTGTRRRQNLQKRYRERKML